ncbi:MAG TPA: GNAT family N-acetyltransferase [Micromonosporaceae bacterium]
MTVRTANDGDLDSIRQVARRALVFDDDAADVVDVLWSAPTTQPDLRVVTEAFGQVTGFALGSLRTATSRDGHIDMFAVDPDRGGAGAGHALLSTLEDRLRAERVERLRIGGNTPYFGWPGIDIRYTGALCLARSSGYQQVRDGHNMTVELAAAPLSTAADEERLAATGITVRRLQAAELDAIDGWVRAFGGTWHIELALAAAADPSRVHVALRGEQYVGFACHGVNRRGWFGPMGTDTSERGSGIGTVLLRRCLDDMREAGLTVADIGWVGPYQFYWHSVGATLTKTYWIFEKAA